MANTVIQIKRSTTDTTPANVVFGELAYTTNGDILYIGDSTNTAVAIAGKRTPGVMVANQALVTNSSGFIDNLNAEILTVINTASVGGTLTIGGLEISPGGAANISGDITVQNVYATNISVSNTLTVNGDIILRGSSLQLGDGGDVISLGATVNSHIVPTANDTFDLGGSTSFWRKLFVDEIQQPNDAPITRKLDILWKKIGFNKTSTDYAALKKATDETIVSDLIIKPTEIWNQIGSIPAVKPASNSGVVEVYVDLECQEDTTATAKRTWKTNLTNWIPPRFGITYQIVAYVDTAGSTDASSNGTQVTLSGSNDDGWYFDYQSGVLHFLGSNIPAAITNSTSVFVTGARYIGNTGFNGTVLTNGTLINATISSLSTPLSVADGGTGVTSFTANSLLAAANSSTLGFKTGANGQVMIVLDNDVNFSDLDGGTY